MVSAISRSFPFSLPLISFSFIIVSVVEPDCLSRDRNGIMLIAQFSAAWFKLYLDKTPTAYGIDFNSMIYGTGVEGMCSGGDGTMTSCIVGK